MEEPLEITHDPGYVFYDAEVVPIGPSFVKVEGSYYLNIDEALARDWDGAPDWFRPIHWWLGNLHAICQEHDPT